MRRLVLTVVLVGLLTAGLSATPAGAGAPPSEVEATTWVCKPGMRHDACAMRFTTTSFTPTGEKITVSKPHRSRLRRRFDCFYVYPTVSDQKTPNADRTIDPEIRSIVRYQAARYGQHCRVYAPVYRQATLQSIQSPGSGAAFASAYADVQDAFDEYLAHDNHGRGFVLIGHSQGSGMLTQLVQHRIDNNPKVRRRLVSAILLGGNVTVASGKDVGGSFRHVPACRSRRQTGCVVAFSTFGEPPPPDAIFGRPGGALSGGGSTAGVEVLCTNPASLHGGAKPVTAVTPAEPYAPGTTIGAATLAVGGFPAVEATTGFVAFPKAYRAECSDAGGANVLLVTPRGGAPTPHAIPSAAWGLHLLDANVAQGNLVALVRDQVHAYARHH
jgi:Protein of unknown function (DUF3089)